MATAKSVITIDVEDESFKRFAESFKKFQDAVNQTKKSTKDLGDEAARSGQKATSAWDKFNKTMRDLKTQQRDNITLMKDMAKWSAQVATNFSSIAFNAARWVAYGALGGGFGLGGLAAQAGDRRREAQGLGVSTGELRSAEVSFNRYIDAKSFLGNLASIQSDASKRFVLQGLGINDTSKSAAQLLPELLPRLVQEFTKRGGLGATGQQVFSSMGLENLTDFQTMRRLATLSGEELNTAITQFKQNLKKFELDDKISRDWQDFQVALHEAGNQIEVSLTKHLGNLTPQLVELSHSVAEAIDTFLSNPEVKVWLKDLGEQIKKFAVYLASPEFKQDIADFMEGLGKIVDFIKTIVGWLPDRRSAEQDRQDQEYMRRKYSLTESNALGAKNYDSGGWEDEESKNSPGTQADRNHNPGNIRNPITGRFQTYGSTSEGFQAMARLLQKSKLYGGGGNDTIQGILAKYAPASENDTASYISDVSRKTGFGSSEHLNLNDPIVLSKLMTAMAQHEGTKNKYTPESVRIMIQNNTGGSAVVSASQMGAAQ